MRCGCSGQRGGANDSSFGKANFHFSELFEAKNFGLRKRDLSVCELLLNPLQRNGFKSALYKIKEYREEKVNQ